MTSDSSATTGLIQDLEKLSQDPRLARVFRDSGACSLYLWLLELTQNTKTEYRLLFGWVIPATYRDPDKWYSSDGGKAQNLGTENNPYKFRIAQLTLHHDSHAIFRLIKELVKGFSLDDSCKKAGIVPPAHEKNPYGQLCLAKSPRQLAQSFAVRPVIFLETGQTNRTLIRELQPTVSPIDNVPAFSGNLCRLNKLSLFSRNEKEQLSQADNLVKRCLLHLAEETGLNFCTTDSERLGNIEWLSFPAADEYENSPVKIELKSSHCGIQVKILKNFLQKGTKILVGCELRGGGEVILNQCKTAEIADETAIIDFEAQEKVTKTIITIWTHDKDKDNFEVWYKDSYTILEQINVTSGGWSSQGTLEWERLQESANPKNPDVANRVKQARTTTQLHHDHSLVVGGNNCNPWILADRQIRIYTQRLFPQPSEGAFFIKGWDAQESGFLSFVEWFQRLTCRVRTGKILIFDPYFEPDGIKLVVLARNHEIEYEIFTNTQIKKSTAEKLQKDLIKECKKYESTLEKFKFYIRDLRSKGGGDTQLFHDRYILVFDESGKSQKGYHLSNSIQGATKNHPLIVTPIPIDVLDDIEGYICSLLAPANDSPNHVITLFDSNRSTEIYSDSQHQQGIAAIPYAGFFFAALLNEDRLSYLEESELSNNLQDKGIFIREGSGFTVTKQVNSQLNYFVQILIASSEKIFAKLWTALGAWLAHSHQSGKYFEQLVHEGGENLARKIKSFLSNTPTLESPIGLLGANQNNDSSTITHLMLQPYPTVLRFADELLKKADSRLWYSFSDDWGIQYAAQALVQLYPERLIMVVAELRDALKEINENNSNYWAIANTLTSVIKQILNQLIQIQYTGVTDNRLLSALLRSDVPLLRAIAAQSLSPLRNQHIDLQNAFNTIDVLPERERLYALAEWVFELRIRANQNNRHENEELKNIRLQIFDKIRQVWVKNLSADKLRDVVHRLSGPSEGSWAVSTNNELLLPLREDNKLTVDEIAQLWLTILVERLEACISATIHKPDNQSSRSWFDELTDRELTFTCGWAIANATEDCRTKWRDKLNKKIFNPAKRTINRAFSRSLDFYAWKGACDSLLWLKVLVEITRFYGVDGTIGKENELEELVSRLEKDNIDITLWTGTKDILELLSEVKQDIEKHLSLPE